MEVNVSNKGGDKQTCDVRARVKVWSYDQKTIEVIEVPPGSSLVTVGYTIRDREADIFLKGVKNVVQGMEMRIRFRKNGAKRTRKVLSIIT